MLWLNSVKESYNSSLLTCPHASGNARYKTDKQKLRCFLKSSVKPHLAQWSIGVRWEKQPEWLSLVFLSWRDLFLLLSGAIGARSSWSHTLRDIILHLGLRSQVSPPELPCCLPPDEACFAHSLESVLGCWFLCLKAAVPQRDLSMQKHLLQFAHQGAYPTLSTLSQLPISWQKNWDSIGKCLAEHT